jgi:hypothetical protein
LLQDEHVYKNTRSFFRSTISSEASEALVLYRDETRNKGVTYFYRIKATNEAGETDYSNVVDVRDL